MQLCISLGLVLVYLPLFLRILLLCLLLFPLLRLHPCLTCVIGCVAAGGALEVNPCALPPTPQLSRLPSPVIITQVAIQILEVGGVGL